MSEESTEPEGATPSQKPAPRASGAARAAAAKSTRQPAKSATPRQAAAKSATPKQPAAKPAAQKSTTAKPAASAQKPAARAPRATPARTPRKPTAQAPVETAPVAEPVELEPATAAEVDSTENAPAEAAQARPEPAGPIPATDEPGPLALLEPVPFDPSKPVEPVLELEGLTKRYGEFAAVDDVTLALDPGTFTGIVGPNGAGKTTTLSMITGLLRPTKGTVRIAGIDVWKDPIAAKRQVGVLPDRLHMFDRLTGAQLLYYTGVLHGLDGRIARRRASELAEAFKIEHAMSRLVTDYSSGMLKKVALAAALIHAPRLLVLDEPFESVDPVSSVTVAKILKDFVAAGGTVLLSSHSMELVQRICDHVAVIVEGRLIAGGTVDEVRGDQSLQERFIELAGHDDESIADLTWLHRFSG